MSKTSIFKSTSKLISYAQKQGYKKEDLELWMNVAHFYILMQEVKYIYMVAPEEIESRILGVSYQLHMRGQSPYLITKTGDRKWEILLK